ncbi:hypothetical protein RUM43_010276 [Polyplax serrata]|uniref:DDRGK domain-containing protein 1 n=1 Tax=Polyplax serrata TaxID=468196 RepID=A0AAN8P776_POLSC
MDIVILLFIAAIVVIAVGFLTLYRNRNLPKAAVQHAPQEAAAPQPGARRRALAAARNTRARQRVVEEDDDDEGEGDTPELNLPDTKIGAKKLAKLQAKAEKKAQREAEEKIRQEKKKQQQLADEERKKQQLEEEEEERRRAEQERKIREERERQEHEEYLNMKQAFSVQEEGFDEVEESESLIQDFIQYIKNNKIVILEDLAAEFKLKTQDVINRINSLQNDGQLTGVIDDRGKFIFISQEELDAVAKFVKQRGRVSIAELVENSNRLISLTPVESC